MQVTDDCDLRLGADMRRQIFLIFKESLHHALRQSGCARVAVEFSVEEGWLKLSIQIMAVDSTRRGRFWGMGW
jgi:hypothetical protein